MSNSDYFSNSEIQRSQMIKKLMHAAIEGNVVEVKEILQHKIEVDAIDSTDPQQSTALHLASENGRLSVVRLLLEKGADPMKVRQDENGRNSFHLAAGNGHTDIVALILERAKGLDINKTGKLGMTALYRAATNGHVSTVRLLLFYGADPNKTDLFGMTALESASLSKHPAIVKLLRVFSAISFCVKEEELLLDAKIILDAYAAKTGAHKFSSQPFFDEIFRKKWELNHVEIRQNLKNLKVTENDLDPAVEFAKDLLKEYVLYKINRKLTAQN